MARYTITAYVNGGFVGFIAGRVSVGGAGSGSGGGGSAFPFPFAPAFLRFLPLVVAALDATASCRGGDGNDEGGDAVVIMSSEGDLARGDGTGEGEGGEGEADGAAGGGSTKWNVRDAIWICELLHAYQNHTSDRCRWCIFTVL